MGLDISHYHASNNRKAENNEVFSLEEMCEDEEAFDEGKGSFAKISLAYAKFIYSYDGEQFFQAKNAGYAGKILKTEFYKEWTGGFYITSLDELWLLRGYCKEEYLEHFDNQFTNQWREGISLVTLSW